MRGVFAQCGKGAEVEREVEPLVHTADVGIDIGLGLGKFGIQKPWLAIVDAWCLSYII